MKYLSIDLETTGLDPNVCQILEVGAVVEDTEHTEVPIEELPGFHCYVVNEPIVGSAYGLHVNHKILERIAIKEKPYLYLAPGEVYPALRTFIRQQIGTKRNTFLAGKNVANFDRRFLRLLPGWLDNVFQHRTIDPVLYYWHSGEELPSMQTCLERAGLTGQVAHTALEDAKLVVQLIRRGPGHLRERLIKV